MLILLVTRFVLSAICMELCSAVPERSENEVDTDFYFLEDNEELEFANKGLLKLPSLYDILGTFDLCLLSCTGRACGCCHKLFRILSVCGSSYIDPLEKTLEINVKLAGRRVYQTITPLDKLQYICRTANVDNVGDVGVCVNTSLSVHDEHPDSFRVCAEAEIQLNQVSILVVTLNCLEFSGDIVFEGKEGSLGKRVASIRILNPLLLANEFRKMITNRIFG